MGKRYLKNRLKRFLSRLEAGHEMSVASNGTCL